MKNIKIKSIIFTVVISISCTILHAQNQFNLNAYHNYSTFIDLNCSLNGESNGKEFFLFYADNRSESKISFTVNYTITDNCGKSHSGSWSTNIIQAGQRGSNVESVYTGCPIQKGKGHLVKNITCTVSNFKDLSKNESDLNVNKITEQQNKNNTSTSTPSGNDTYNRNSATSETPVQRSNREQQERIATKQQQDEALTNQIVQGTTELLGMIGNMLSSSNSNREKRLEKKANDRKIDDYYREKSKLENLETINDNIKNAEMGDDAAIYKVGFAFMQLDDFEASRYWFMTSVNKNSKMGMKGMAELTNRITIKKIKAINISEKLKDSVQVEIDWYSKAANLGCEDAYLKLIEYFIIKKVYSVNGKLEITSDDYGITNISPWKTLKNNEKILESLISGANKMDSTPLIFLDYYYFKESEKLYVKGLQLYDKKDYIGALPYFEKSAKMFSNKSLALLSTMYINGQGIKANAKEGFNLALKSAHIGNKWGMKVVAFCYQNGVGVQQSDLEAREWDRKFAVLE